jgi:hypothetical protein
MLAQVRQLARDERGRRGRDEHLPAVAGGRDAGHAMDIRTDVTLVGQQRRPCVQTDADLDQA